MVLSFVHFSLHLFMVYFPFSLLPPCEIELSLSARYQDLSFYFNLLVRLFPFLSLTLSGPRTKTQPAAQPSTSSPSVLSLTEYLLFPRSSCRSEGLLSPWRFTLCKVNLFFSRCSISAPFTLLLASTSPPIIQKPLSSRFLFYNYE